LLDGEGNFDYTALGMHGLATAVVRQHAPARE
jgi:hypothetical protein